MNKKGLTLIELMITSATMIVLVRCLSYYIYYDIKKLEKPRGQSRDKHHS
ncbi:MAG: prepilin-type N-terminal cleavage/methylation domain-containing protein [Candidatus Omnitrophota bacterium]